MQVQVDYSISFFKSEKRLLKIKNFEFSLWKDEDNNLVFGKRLPVDLTDLTGCMIEEHESLLTGQCSRCSLGTGYVFEEMLSPTTAEVIAKWVDNPFGDYAAVTLNRCGKGECYYLGSSFDDEMMDKLFDRILS